MLHISPESAIVDSIFGIIENGDFITLDAERRLLEVDLSYDVIQWRINRRRENLAKEESKLVGKRVAQKKRGYRGLYESRVNQAELGCDFDFLRSDGADMI